MKYLTIFGICMTVLLFVACSNGESEATVAPPATEIKPALATAESIDPSSPANGPAALLVESYPGDAPVVETDAPYPDPASTSASDVSTGSAYPVEVNVSDITSEPVNDDRETAPRPGVPDEITPVIQRVSEDLATRLGIDISAITAVETDMVEWPDSSLGCPAEGETYDQILTPGIFVALEAAGQPYNYHTDRNGNFVLCSEDGAPVTE